MVFTMAIEERVTLKKCHMREYMRVRFEFYNIIQSKLEIDSEAIRKYYSAACPFKDREQ